MTATFYSMLQKLTADLNLSSLDEAGASPFISFTGCYVLGLDDQTWSHVPTYLPTSCRLTETSVQSTLSPQDAL